MEKKKSNAALVIILLVTAALISFAPLFVLKDAEFGGADDRGNTLIETTDPDYEPWASPILEVILGGEFCTYRRKIFLFAVHSASLCGQPLHPSGRLCIYDNWDPDCLQGQNPSY